MADANTLDDMLRCFICFEHVKDPVLCYKCSKIGCRDCLQRWLTEQKQSCPHCRCPLRSDQLVSARFMEDVFTELSKLQTNKEKVELCKEHTQIKTYYCTDCNDSLCSDCVVLQGNHKDHTLERLEKVYDNHVALVRAEMSTLDLRMDRLAELEKNLTMQMALAQANKDQESLNMEAYVAGIEQKLQKQLKSKLLLLLSQRNDIVTQSALLGSLLSELNTQLDPGKCQQAAFIARTPELLEMLREVSLKPLATTQLTIPTSFHSEVVPDWHTARYRLGPDYLTLRSAGDVCYSPVLNVYGQQWRLKVYPNGNGASENIYLSVFLELADGHAASNGGEFEYRIELIHPTDASRRVSRVFSSTFERSECWGYSRFVKLEEIIDQEYMCQPSGFLQLQFSLRYPNYKQASTAQMTHIEYLEKLCDNQRILIDTLSAQRRMDHKQEISSEQPVAEEMRTIHMNDDNTIQQPHPDVISPSLDVDIIGDTKVHLNSVDHDAESKQFDMDDARAEIPSSGWTWTSSGGDDATVQNGVMEGKVQMRGLDEKRAYMNQLRAKAKEMKTLMRAMRTSLQAQQLLDGGQQAELLPISDSDSDCPNSDNDDDDDDDDDPGSEISSDITSYNQAVDMAEDDDVLFSEGEISAHSGQLDLPHPGYHGFHPVSMTQMTATEVLEELGL